jgi:hypothetical protein
MIELQQLIGKINFIRRFISNLSGWIEPFMDLVKIKADEEFRWGAEQQWAFKEIKKYLARPPVLVPPHQDRPFYIYLSVGDTSIASVVVQVRENTSPSEASYSASICCTISPKAFQKMWSFHIDHQVPKLLIEKVKEWIV